MAIDPENPLLNGPRRIDARPQLRHEVPAGLAPLTEAEIMAARTPAGAWSKATLAGWGVAWPPPKGWKERLLSGQPQEPAAPRGAPPAAPSEEPTGRVPGPQSPDFDSTRHGLLAPPRVTYRKLD